MLNVTTATVLLTLPEQSTLFVQGKNEITELQL